MIGKALNRLGNRKTSGAPLFHHVRSSSSSLRRELGEAILAAFAILDPDHHARAVDVGDLERHHLRGAQARAVGDAERSALLEARRAPGWRTTSSGVSTGRNASSAHQRDELPRAAPAHRDAEEEAQRDGVRVDAC